MGRNIQEGTEARGDLILSGSCLPGQAFLFLIKTYCNFVASDVASLFIGPFLWTFSTRAQYNICSAKSENGKKGRKEMEEKEGGKNDSTNRSESNKGRKTNKSYATRLVEHKLN